MRIITGKTSGEKIAKLYLSKLLRALNFFYFLINMKMLFFILFRAIKKFTAGIKVDPTYVRAYVCRGEAYHKIHDVSTQVMQQMCSNLWKITIYEHCNYIFKFFFFQY